MIPTHLERGEVDDTVDVRVGLEDLVESTLLGDVNLDELRSLSGDELNAVDDLVGRVVEVVRDDDLVAGLD